MQAVYWYDPRDLAAVNQEKPPLHEIVRAIEEALAKKGRWLTNIGVRRPPNNFHLIGFNFSPGWLMPHPTPELPNYHHNETLCMVNTLEEALTFIEQFDEAQIPQR